MQEHRLTPPLPHSYQFRIRAIFNGADNPAKAKDELDRLAWKADHQVQALRDKIEYLEGLLQGAQII